MELIDFAQDYSELAPGEQALFQESIRRLLSDGIIWRDDAKDQRVYSFLQRHRDLVEAYIAVAGWELHFNELLSIFRVQHRDGAHKRRLNRDTTVWLLLLRLLYAEKRERMEVITTPNPVVSMSEIILRYTSYFPGQAVRKKTSLQEALRALASMKLVRLHRMSSSDPSIELLPTLEEVVPANAIAEVAARLEQFARRELDGHNGHETVLKDGEKTEEISQTEEVGTKEEEGNSAAAE
jgi:hypothetical protein